MATRVGIELSPTACRIVEVDAGGLWRREKGDTRVRSFAVLPPSGPETQAKLESLRRRQAAVVVWGGRSEHRQVMVTSGSYESMRAEALASLAAAGLTTSGVWADIAPASPPDDLARRRPVVVSMASASDMADALQPLREAGIRLRTVTTPAVALGSIARMRRAFSVPGAIESYVALDAQVTCIALARNGVLLAARELAWGFIDENYAHVAQRTRDDITTRLTEAIGDFVAAIGGEPTDIGQVCMCGAMPDLRTMSALLMERLDVEVEPLDSLFGIDAARLPEPADEFRERGAELRLAWAAAADWPPAINLLRARRRQVSKTWLGRAAVVAGAAAGLGGSWWVVERSRLVSAPVPVTRTASDAAGRGRATPPVMPTPRGGSTSAAPPKPVVATTKAPVVPPKPVVVPPPPAVERKAPAVVTPPPAVERKAPVVVPPPAVERKAPVVVPPPAVERKAPVVAPPPAVERRAPAVVPPPAVERKAPVIVPPPVATRAPAVPPSKPAPPPEVALPFDAVLGTILYSPDRKLAIVDNRIVGVGDEVRGARITEITPGAVLLRDGQGRLRRLTLGATVR